MAPKMASLVVEYAGWEHGLDVRQGRAVKRVPFHGQVRHVKDALCIPARAHAIPERAVLTLDQDTDPVFSRGFPTVRGRLVVRAILVDPRPRGDLDQGTLLSGQLQRLIRYPSRRRGNRRASCASRRDFILWHVPWKVAVSGLRDSAQRRQPSPAPPSHLRFSRGAQRTCSHPASRSRAS